MKISASSNNFNITLAPSGELVSTTIPFLPEFSISNNGHSSSPVGKFHCIPTARVVSPKAGSMLITSAPQSAKTRPLIGAATKFAYSMTFNPSSNLRFSIILPPIIFDT